MRLESGNHECPWCGKDSGIEYGFDGEDGPCAVCGKPIVIEYEESVDPETWEEDYWFTAIQGNEEPPSD